MTAEQDERNIREAIERAVSESNFAAARRSLSDLWRLRPGPALAGFVTSRAERVRDAFSVKANLFLLRSCTFEPVVPIFRAASFAAGLDTTVRVGDFNAYAQEILDEGSALYASKPDVVILAVHSADVAPELWESFADLTPNDGRAVVSRVLGTFRDLLAEFRKRSRAQVVLHDLEAPQFAARGIYDAQAVASQREAIAEVNRGLRELSREHKGVYVLDYDGLVARHGRENWHDSRKWAAMRVPLRAERMASLADEWLRFLHPLTGKICKALVVDLDNTLWGGVIGEDGLGGIKLGKEHPGAPFQALQRVILDLYQRGIILAVCSKNNHAEAVEVFERHPDMLLRQAHFASVRINWDDKATNLRAIAAELDIGIDSLAFLDDNPAERELVRAELPEVTVIELPGDPGSYAGILRDCPVFERLALSAEDRERGRYYAEERQRSELQQQTTSLEEFYRSLAISIRIARVTAATVPRVSQLTQKTNQFNLTTRRYTEQQIESMAADPAYRVYALSASDRFGDNGLVGVAIMKLTGGAVELDTFLLSCRVIGRTIETALLATLCDDARVDGARRLDGTFIATKKNTPSREFFAVHGFSRVSESEGETRWSLDLNATLPACPPWIVREIVRSDLPS
jgi:FkbH-like protein